MPDDLIIRDVFKNLKALRFCQNFVKKDAKRYIFGRNERTQAIINHIKVDGIIDDFTSESEFCGVAVVKLENIPNNAMVVSTSIGRPLASEKRMGQFQFEYIDYYSFYKYSYFPLENITYWDGMVEDIKINYDKYNYIYHILEDSISKNQFYNIINFRVSYDLNFMRGFSNIEHLQYFEDFLNLGDDEVFIDIGGYDGFTSEEFIKRYPNYKSVHVFEPERGILVLAKGRLKKYKNINFYQIGLLNGKKILNFEKNGVGSKISSNGNIEINVDKLDNVLKEKPTFIKMDIEGAESYALEGAKEIIKQYRPKLAISVYHKKDDFWKIPMQILAIDGDYSIYLRHYTEAHAETVMFFIPKA